MSLLLPKTAITRLLKFGHNRLVLQGIQHRLSSHDTTNKTLLCHKLNHRGIVRTSGKDASAFLQGLITNDMGCLDTKCDISSMYAMLLNIQGRVLYDMIIYKTDSVDDKPTYLIECDKETVDDFISTVKRYRIRKKVDITDVSQEFNTWAVCPDNLAETGHSMQLETIETQKDNIIAMCVDPRVKTFGTRLILPDNVNADSVVPNGVISTDELSYHLRRYRYGLGEGIVDMPPGNSIPLESNAVFMNGVSFDKGCYIGQELTARSHYTGVIRKRLMPVQIHSDTHNCQPGDKVENTKSKNCGKFRNAIGQYGLALLRIGDVLGYELSVKNAQDQVVGHMNTWIPQWWPRDTDEVIKKALTQLQNEKEKMTEEQ